MKHKHTTHTSKYFLSFLIISFFTSQFIFAQKINPDFAGIKVKTKTETIYKSKNSSEDLKSVKSVTDSKGNTYVLFCDGNLGTAYLASNSGGSWKTEMLSNTESGSFTDGEGTVYAAMDIDKNNCLHVALVGYPGNIYYGYRSSGGKWKFETVSKDKMPQLHNFYIFQNYFDLKVDERNGVHIIARADIDSRGHSALYLYKPASGGWSSEIIRQGINDTEKDYGNDPAIVINGEKIIVSFGGEWSLNYAEKNIGSKSWQIEELLKDSKTMNAGKYFTSLALTPEGKPVISFQEYKSSDLRGINVITKKDCSDEWTRTSVFDESTSGSAVTVDKYGVIWLGFCNDGDFTKLSYRSCNADRSFKSVINLKDRSKSFLDMFVDSKNHIHLFYPTYEDEIKHIEAWFEGEPEIDNNIIPVITSKMKPHIKTGDYWKTTLKAFDPECDKIDFYSDNLPVGFTLSDHNNGLATLRSENINIPGEYKFQVFVTDENHTGDKKPISGIDIKLIVSDDGKQKGSYKYIYNEGSFSKNKWVKLDAVSSNLETIETKTQSTKSGAAVEMENDTTKPEVTGQSDNCTEYLDRFETWANKYIEQRKKLKKNPMDFNAVQKLAAMAPELGNWGLEWQNKHSCSNDPAFMKRYEEINARIDEVN